MRIRSKRHNSHLRLDRHRFPGRGGHLLDLLHGIQLGVTALVQQVNVLLRLQRLFLLDGRQRIVQNLSFEVVLRTGPVKSSSLGVPPIASAQLLALI